MDDMPAEKHEHLQPLVSGWLSKIQLARRKKKTDFQDVADECNAFFYDKDGFLWDPKYKFRFTNKSITPKFKMTMNKAFEFLALYGPMMYHKNPYRQVRPRESMSFPPQMFGVDPSFQPPPPPPPPQPGQPPQPAPPIDPALQQKIMQQQQAQAAFQQANAQQEQMRVEDDVRAGLMESYLNYIPNEMPGGGFRAHGMKALNESLVKGGGVLWTLPYQPPNAQHKLIVSEFDSINNLFIDSDATDLNDAMWVARQCTHPVWQVEREYNLAPGTLKGKGTSESDERRATMADDARGERDGDHEFQRRRGETADLITYYKIWSKMGIGVRLSGSKLSGEAAMSGEQLDEILGDYCYLVVAPDVPFPLNFPAELLDEYEAAEASEDPQQLQAAEEAMKQVAGWPIPYWADDRWPFTMIAYYYKANCPWPIAPIAPGLGELKFINVMVSHLCNRIWSSMRDIIGVAKAAAAEFKKQVQEGDDQCIVEIESVVGQNINEMVQFIQQPQTNLDAWKILEQMLDIFADRVGLNELLYGSSATQIRSATDAENKNNKVSIRPDYMAGVVEDAFTEVARKEAFCARWFLTSQDISLSMGPVAGQIWEQYVASDDIERVVREFEYRVEESSARKPNIDRDAANMQQAMQVLLPVLAQEAETKGDVAPFNGLVTLWGKSIQMNVSGMLLQPPPPPPGPPPAVMEAQQKQQEMQLDAQKHGQDMQFSAQEHAQQMQQEAQQMAFDRQQAVEKLKQQQAATAGAKAAAQAKKAASRV